LYRVSRVRGSIIYILDITTSIVRVELFYVTRDTELIVSFDEVGIVVALTKKNSNAAEILTFLHKFVAVRSASILYPYSMRVG